MQPRKTRVFNFELYLFDDKQAASVDGQEFLNSVEETLFEAFKGDVTPAILGGMPVLYCTVDGASIGDAVDRVMNTIMGTGLQWSQIARSPDDHFEVA